MIPLLFYRDLFLFLLCEIQSLEHLQINTMNLVIIFQGHVCIAHVICWVKHSLVVDFDENQGLLDLQQVLDILQVLLIDACTEPDHEDDSCDDKEDVVDGVNISD
jgi:hypothetical protein